MEDSNPTLAKIPILDTGKFKNGNSGYNSISRMNTMPYGRNDVKARTTQLLALLDEHQLRFSKCETAQELWAAILKTFAKNRSGNGEVNTASIPTASIPTASTQVSPASANVAAALMAIDGVGWDRCYMANEEDDHALVAEQEALIEFALMAKSSSDNEVFDNSLCSKACKKNTDSLNTKITKLSEKLSGTKTTLYHYKLGISQVEARLVEFKNQEIKLCEKIKGLEFSVESKNNRNKRLTNELKELKKEKEGLDSKLIGFQSVSKDLDTLLGSQRFDKNKEGLGYSVVPPPPAQVYSSPKKDMSWTGLPEFADDTITDYMYGWTNGKHGQRIIILIRVDHPEQFSTKLTEHQQQ
nr:hypothetical protein [Tanacetum cinerariifolium]